MQQSLCLIHPRATAFHSIKSEIILMTFLVSSTLSSTLCISLQSESVYNFVAGVIVGTGQRAGSPMTTQERSSSQWLSHVKRFKKHTFESTITTLSIPSIGRRLLLPSDTQNLGSEVKLLNTGVPSHTV